MSDPSEGLSVVGPERYEGIVACPKVFALGGALDSPSNFVYHRTHEDPSFNLLVLRPHLDTPHSQPQSLP